MPSTPYAEPSPSSTASGPWGKRGSTASAAVFFPGRRDDVAGRVAARAGRSGAAGAVGAWTGAAVFACSGVAGPVNVSGASGCGATAGAGAGAAGVALAGYFAAQPFRSR